MTSWTASKGKVVVDLGAGNGILGIGALLLGAAHVVFVETDEEALGVLRSNVASLEDDLLIRANIIAAHVGLDDLPVNDADLFVMNPPWGVQRERADRPFLETAFTSGAQAVHLLHSDGRAISKPLPNHTVGRPKPCCEPNSAFQPSTSTMRNEPERRTSSAGGFTERGTQDSRMKPMNDPYGGFKRREPSHQISERCATHLGPCLQQE